jgi:hypothetical protein
MPRVPRSALLRRRAHLLEDVQAAVFEGALELRYPVLVDDPETAAARMAVAAGVLDELAAADWGEARKAFARELTP